MGMALRGKAKFCSHTLLGLLDRNERRDPGRRKRIRIEIGTGSWERGQHVFAKLERLGEGRLTRAFDKNSQSLKVN